MPTALNAPTTHLMEMLKYNYGFDSIKSFIESSKDSVRWNNVYFLHLIFNSKLSFTVELIDYLLSNNFCKVDNLNLEGESLLNVFCAQTHINVFCNSLDLLKILVKHGADVNRQNHLGNSPVDSVLKSSASSKLIDYLLTHGANPNFLYAKRKSYLEFCADNVFKYYYTSSKPEKTNIYAPLIELFLKHGTHQINPMTGVYIKDVIDRAAAIKASNSPLNSADTLTLNKINTLLSIYDERNVLKEKLPLSNNASSPTSSSAPLSSSHKI